MITTLTPSQRRIAWLEDLFAPIHAYIDQASENPPVDSVLWTNLLDRVAAEGQRLGRSPEWRNALSWHVLQRKIGRDASWVALQGNVWLSHAA